MSSAYTEQLLSPCRSASALHLWVRNFLGMDIPVRAVCAGHDAPFEYLRRSYFEPGRDLVVWAPRGGGKTRLGAVATLLDLLHKPGISVRILGGSVEQSLKMWEHLLPDLEHLAGDWLAGRTRSRRVELASGSRAAVLTQSQRAVRGLRVQKLRCDEVELFDPDVWEAAQLVTQSMKLHHPVDNRREADLSGDSEASWTEVAGVVEALSTLHAPYGLMNKVVESAQSAGTPVVRWCVLDVLERCPRDRECNTCPLWDDCRGVAKERCNGFVRIDDAIAMKRRVSASTWQAEMLCRRPSVRDSVFPAFDPAVHVREAVAMNSATIQMAIDFGYANPFVCLWIANGGGQTHVIDEYVQPRQTVQEHVKHLALRPWGAGRGTTIGCDPAGNGRNEQTGRSSVDALKSAGYVVRYRPSRIVDGLELIRAGLKPAVGESTLFIHPRCTRLIKAMRSYHYPAGGGELPVKDGEHDHLIDALRYHFVNQTPMGKLTGGRRY